jgi:hypothetical protein
VTHQGLQRVAAERLRNQFITRGLRGDAAALVARLGAVQAQEYPFAKWALSLRLARECPDASLDAVFDDGRLLRTHVLRPTWHFVAADDIRWMLDLAGPRVQRALTTYARRAGIEARTLSRGAALIERALGGGRSLTRQELGARLARAGITLSGTPLAFMAMHAELEGLICSGPRRGRQFTYALLDERAPNARRLPRDEALAELVRRYFSSHGPATVRDFVWWSGLTVADTRRGLAMTRAVRESIGGIDYWRIGRPAPAPSAAAVRLLPIYDEYVVAYRDRVAVPHVTARLPHGVIFRHALVVDGQVAGTWNVRRAPAGWALRVVPSRRLSAGEKQGVAREAERFARFLGAPVAFRVR